MTALPNSLALIVIPDGAPIIAADHRTNYGGVQAAVNQLITALSGGVPGQVLGALSPSSVGWVAAGGDWQVPAAVTLTYGTTDGHTFTVTTGGIDLTGQIGPGARLRLTDVTTKYFIVTAITATTITLYGGQNYALTGGAITLPAFSTVKAPIGFPLDPSIWTEQLLDASDRTIVATTLSVWYALPALTLVVPIGAWRLEYSGLLGQSGSAQSILCTLASASAAQTDTDLTTAVSYGSTPTFPWVGRDKNILLAAKTTWFLNVLNKSGGGGPSAGFYGASFTVPTRIRAVCNYL